MKLLRSILVGVAVAGLVSCSNPQGSLTPMSLRQSRFDRSGPAGLGTPRFETERNWAPAHRDDWEPVTAADPSSRWVYQMTTQQKPNVLLFRSSSDGGMTWNRARYICRRGIDVHFQFDPQVAVARNGTIDVVCLDNFLPGVVFTQSTDRGKTWSAPVRLDRFQRYSDKPTLLVSPSGADVYAAYNDFYALYVAASHDGGRSWSRPARATTAHLWYYSYGGTIAPDGTVWFAVDGEAGKNQTGDGHIALVRSTDGGSNWTTIPMALTHEGAPCSVKNCYPDFYTGQVAVAADSAGTMVCVYAKNDVAQGPNALYVRRSNDGVAWSAPATIAAAGNSTSPTIAAGPRPGDFRLVWQDDRNGAQAWNTWYARSVDDGRTWSAGVRLSNRGSGAPYKNRGGYDFPFGDYLGLSVDAGGVSHVIWGEGSAVYVPGGTWYTRGN